MVPVQGGCALIIPTRGRPQNLIRLTAAISGTAGSVLRAVVAVVDDDDPCAQQYRVMLGATAPWVELRVISEPRKIGPIINRVALELAGQYDYLGFMGDDHRPLTVLWDEKLTAAIGEQPGVAYGNDLYQGENLPTSVIMSSALVTALGYMCPPGLEHLYLDDFWKQLGTDVGNLHYLSDVIIEHCHPAAGKADMDEGYSYSLSPVTMNQDGLRYAEFLRSQWPADLAGLKEAVGG